MIANKVVSYFIPFLLLYYILVQMTSDPEEPSLDPVSTQDPIIVCYYINN